MNAPRDASFNDYLSDALKDPAEAAAYIEAVMELDDKTLFKALSENGNPTLSTIHKALHAVGLRLSVAPVGEHEAAQA